MAGVWKKGKNQGIRYREHKVRKNGVKFDRYYAVRFKVDNKDYEQGMGWASEGWNEEKCLEVLRELKKNAKEGKGPKTLKEKREEVKRKEEREVSFSSLAEEYLRHHASQKKDGGKSDKRMLDADILPKWRTLKVRDINRRKVVSLLDEIKSKPAPVLANRTLALVRKMFNFGIQRGILENNPATVIQRPAVEYPKERFLSEQEIKSFWHGLDRADIHESIKGILRLILVTGQRPSEVREMRHEEIDGCWWTIPVERLKTGHHKNRRKAHRVFLSPMALEIIGPVKKGLVFPGPLNSSNPVGEASITQAIHRNMEVFQITEHFTAHDLRRTAATMMTKSGVSRFDVSQILNHADGGVTSIYDQNDYASEKERGLKIWSCKLAAILGDQKPDNVIEFRRR